MRPDQTGVTLVTLSPTIVRFDNGNYYKLPHSLLSRPLTFTAGRVVIKQAQRHEIIARAVPLFAKSDGTLRDEFGIVHATFKASWKLGALQVSNVQAR